MELARVKISEAGWQALADDAPNRGAKSNETPRVHHHVFTADLARPRRRSNRMNRRNFITVLSGAAAAWPLAARAQKTAALIGFLISGATDSFAIFVEAFKQGMRDNGMVEGQDYVLDLRYADGDYSRFPTLAAEVVQRKPAAIIVTTISAAALAKPGDGTKACQRSGASLLGWR